MAANKDPGSGSKPSTHCGDFSKISPALLSAVGDLKIFVLWKWAKRAGKWTKPPLRADDPAKSASTTDPATWSTLKQAVASYQANAARVAGVGLVLTSTSVAGVDLDHCRNSDGTVDAWARPILKRALNEMAYVEVSVSGTGFHILGTADRMPVTKVMAVKDAHPDAKVEVYFKPAGRYLTLSAVQHGRTGLALPDISDFVGDVIAQVSGERLVEDVLKKGAPKGERSEEFNKVVWAMAADGLSEDQICEELNKYPQGIAERYVGEGRLEKEVKRCFEKWKDKRGVTLEDFYFFSPHHNFICIPTREVWSGSSVDDRLSWPVVLDKDGKPVINRKGEAKKIPPSKWLAWHRPLDQMTWWPGKPEVVEDMALSGEEWVRHPGLKCFNWYVPPKITRGVAPQAEPWISLIKKIYPDEWDHIVKWFAHRVQKPGEKINHALVLGGRMGIGKDTILEPLKRCVGSSNFRDIEVSHIFEKFNPYLKSVILRISEARDLEANRYQFYDRTKTLITQPTNVCNEKNLRSYTIVNCRGVVITANEKNSLYLPADDRRHFVAWSPLSKGDFSEDYFTVMYEWFFKGGDRHIFAYLQSVDLSKFNASAPPPLTAAFHQIVGVSIPSEDSELADILQEIGEKPGRCTCPRDDDGAALPDAVSLYEIVNFAKNNITWSSIFDWIGDRKNFRAVSYRMNNLGFVSVRNGLANDGAWPLGPSKGKDYVGMMTKRKRCIVYARESLSYRDQLKAVKRMSDIIENVVVPFVDPQKREKPESGSVS
jgi:hypothetical protein